MLLIKIPILSLCNTEWSSELMERKFDYSGYCKKIWLWSGWHIHYNNGAIQRVFAGELWMPFSWGIYSGFLIFFSFWFFKFFIVFLIALPVLFCIKKLCQAEIKWCVHHHPAEAYTNHNWRPYKMRCLKNSNVYVGTWKLGSLVNASKKTATWRALALFNRLWAFPEKWCPKKMADVFSGGSLKIQTVEYAKVMNGLPPLV